MSLRIGIDVGGTNTDAALVDQDLTVIASVKTATRADSGDGVRQAIDKLLAVSPVPPASITAAMLGTTHCTNALVERRALSRVGVIRVGAPATTSVPPFEGMPDDLRQAVEGPAFVIEGGHEFDGREICRLDEDAVRRACAAFVGVADAVAVIGTFSPVNQDHERRVVELVEDILDVPVSASANIGSVGLLERENATILNAALIKTLGTMAVGFEQSLAAHGINADIYFGQNDGTLMSLDFALRFPVLTIGCGPTNSIRGAAHLSGVENALVIDVGGTTTDLGVLVDGFPRQSSTAVSIGGVRTNFRMPDVMSVALGGGTRIHQAADGGICLGPDSVGYRIGSEAQCFGGHTLTATDVALAAGLSDIDGASPPAVPASTQTAALTAITELLNESVDQMKTQAGDIPAVLVGGGQLIVPPGIRGISEVFRPAHAGAANAVGAALGDIAGQVEQVFSLHDTARADARSQAAQDAQRLAIDAGADPQSVEVLSVEELPMSYIDDAIVIKARAAGKLKAS